MKLVLILLFSINVSYGERPHFHPKESEIRQLVSINDPKHKGVSGYIYISETYFASNMLQAFKYVAKAYGKTSFYKLGWGNAYSGHISDYEFDKSKLLDGKGNINKEYLGIEGYRKFANLEGYNGRMQQAYQNAASVLGKALFKSLGWGKQYHGTVKEHISERQELLDKNGDIKEEYKGVEGYKNYSNLERYDGSMIKSFVNASAVLTSVEFAQANWGKQYRGTVIEHTKELRMLTGKDGKVKEKYRGVDGYIRYASLRKYRGNMQKAFTNASAILPESLFKQLGWQSFNGDVNELLFMREILKEGHNEINFEKYFGKGDGLDKAVSEYLYRRGYEPPFKSSLIEKVRRNFRAVVSPSEKLKLGWDSVKSLNRNLMKKPHRSMSNKVISVSRSVKRGTKK